MIDAEILRGRRLEYFTIAYNLAEALVALATGSVSGSLALLGFGIDSLIEIASSLVMVWRLTQTSEEAERLSRRLVACSFFALGSWILWNAALDLRSHEAPEVSWPGIALAALSLVVMPLLARSKREVGFALGSASMVADSRQTSLCAYLSAILLAGLLLHALLGWWWVDAVASLAMTPIIVSEGIDAWRGDACGCGH